MTISSGARITCAMFRRVMVQPSATVEHIRERRAPPEVERLPQQRGGAGVIADGEGTLSVRGDPREPMRVDIVAVDRESVTGRVELHQSAAPVVTREHLAQPGDPGLRLRLGRVRGNVGRFR